MASTADLKTKAADLRRTLAKIDKLTGVDAGRERDADRKRAERDVRRIVIVPACADKVRRAALEADDCVWLRYYFPVLFWYEWQPQQREMIEAIRRAITDGDDQAIAASRGEGKSTICERLLLKYSLQGTIKLSVLFAATGKAAEESLESIMSEVEENDLLLADYPEICAPVRALENTPNRAHYQKVNGRRHDNDEAFEAAETKFSWCGQEIVFPRVPGAPGAGAVIATRGLDAAVRGLKKICRRVDVAVIDDPDTEDSSRSEDQAAKLEKRIDRAIGGLGSQRRGVGRIIITTLQSRIAVSYRFTDLTLKPNMRGKRFRFLITPPDRMDLWEEYMQLRKLDWENDQKGNRTALAMEFYVLKRETMDAGAIVSNPNRFYPDSQISALQFYFDEWARKSQEYVLTELDNDPPEEMGPIESGISAGMIQRQVSGFDRGVIPPGCTVLTHGMDIGKYWIYWAVRAWKPDGTGYTIDYDRHPVLDTKHGSDEGLDRAIHREILHRVAIFRDSSYAQEIRESLTLVDAGYRTDSVYKACADAGMGVMPIKGFGQSAGCVKVAWNDVVRKTPDKQPICDGVFKSKQGETGAKLWLVCASADKWKAWEHDRWMTAQDKPGCLFMWGDKPEGDTLNLDQQGHRHYAGSICAEIEVEDIVKGALVRKWKSNHRENHWLDASYYSDVAAAMKGIRVVASSKPQAKPRQTLAEMAKRA